jgi:hypothetical protein
MDLGSLTFVGLITLGVVNVVTMFYPNLDSRVKFGISLVTAFVLTFVPAEFGNIILEKLKLAIGIAFATSGGYKLSQKIGGQDRSE